MLHGRRLDKLFCTIVEIDWRLPVGSNCGDDCIDIFPDHHHAEDSLAAAVKGPSGMKCDQPFLRAKPWNILLFHDGLLGNFFAREYCF